jgi:hypothetical protein
MTRAVGRTIGLLCLSGCIAGLSARPLYAGECEEHFDSTYALIQSAIFERRGCTTALCHDAGSAMGGLDLTAAVAYDNLVDAPVASIAMRPGIRRVSPSKKENSLLWLNLAAATLPDQWTAPLRAMPQGGLPPLTLDELEVVRLWIESGAPRTGVVPETADLLNACLPPPEPLETKPLAPPAPGTGVQLRAPRQILAAHSEREVCFVVPYDFTDQVPERFRGPSGTTFRYKRIDARQDPLSHHAVVLPYLGHTPITDPAWGPFTCAGGTRDGQPCAPTDLQSCGDDGLCRSEPMPAVGCIGFGPGDASIGFGNDSLFNTMAAGLGSVEGVYAEAPLRGTMIWNSHAFNVTGVPGKLDIWVNLEFAEPELQRYPLQRFTEVFESFDIYVPPFNAREKCSRFVVPANAAILELSSHNHRYGKRFRIWEGAFACSGGPNAGAPCSPLGVDPGLGLDDPCAGTPCTSRQPPRVGDCNRDLEVHVDELVAGVNIALGEAPLRDCPRFDGDGDGHVRIGELLGAVAAAINPSRLRDPHDSLLYTSLSYADPAVVRYDPPLRLGARSATEVERTLTYCALYDNGYTDPTTVKRQSTSPLPVGSFPGGPCGTPVACTAGVVGAPCAGADSTCDSAPGAGDGDCDACPVGFGTTTEDEMFILLGAFFTD